VKHHPQEILSFMPNLKHLLMSNLNLSQLDLSNVSKSLQSLQLAKNNLENLDSLSIDRGKQFLDMKTINMTLKHFPTVLNDSSMYRFLSKVPNLHTLHFTLEFERLSLKFECKARNVQSVKVTYYDCPCYELDLAGERKIIPTQLMHRIPPHGKSCF